MGNRAREVKRPLLALTILARFFGRTTVTREAGVTSRLAIGTPSASATFSSRLMVGTLLPVSIWLSMARLTPASLARRSRECPWRVRSRFKFVLIVAKRAAEWFVRCFARGASLDAATGLAPFRHGNIDRSAQRRPISGTCAPLPQ